MQSASDNAERRAALVRDADTCVACGMCLPRCPTYVEARDEAESPRGRIALARALADGRLEASPHLLSHLDHCLVCQACESVCPAGVPYGRIIDRARSLVAASGKDRRRLPTRLLGWAVARMRRLRMLARAGWLMRPLGVPGLLSRLGPRSLRASVGRLAWPRRWRSHYPAQGPEQGRVSLFLGCVAQALDRRTLDDAVAVLTRLGYAVDVPAGQGCCGALDVHAGREAEGLALAQHNLEAFGDDARQPVLTCASGCGAMLAQYDQLDGWPTDQVEAAHAFVARVKDINAFLADCEWAQDASLATLDKHVGIHVPCSLRNVQRQAAAPERLLERVPGLRVEVVDSGDLCCGAAGTYMLENPRMAEHLGERVLNAVEHAAPDYLVTENVGCALHLEGLGSGGGRCPKIRHPVNLLAESLRVGSAVGPKP